MTHPLLISSEQTVPGETYHELPSARECNSFSARRFLATLVGLIAFTVSPDAHAAKFLDGAYGSKEGCIYAKTGDSSGADDFLLLTDERVTTSVSVCDFKGAATKTSTGFTIKAECDAEGEKGPVETATITKSAKGYTVSFPDGTKLGPMPKCH
jgi:hypothetical protein